MNGTNPDIMAIHFYSPIFILFFRYDSKDDKIDDIKLKNICKILDYI